MTFLKALFRIFFCRPKKRGFSRYDLFLLLGVVALTTLLCIFPSQQSTTSSATASIQTSSSHVQTSTQGVSGAIQQPSRSQTAALAYTAHLAPAPTPTDPCSGFSGAPNAIQQCGPNTSSSTSQPQQPANSQLCQLANDGAPNDGQNCTNSTNCTTVGNYTNDCPLNGLTGNSAAESSNANGKGTSLTQGNILFFFTSPADTVDNASVIAIWKACLLIVDLFIALLVVLNGFTIMLGGTVFRYAKVLEALPGILLALVTSQASLFIITIFLGLNNTLSVDLYNWSANAISQNKALQTQATVPVQIMVPRLKTTPLITTLTDQYGLLLKAGNPETSPFATDPKTRDPEVPNYTLISQKTYDNPPRYDNQYGSNPPPIAIQNCYMYNGSTPPVSVAAAPVFEETGQRGLRPATDTSNVQDWLCEETGRYQNILAAIPSSSTVNMQFSNLQFTNLITVNPNDPSATFANIKSLADIFPLAEKILALMLIAQLALRYLFLLFYIVISPLGLACWAMPGRAGQPMTRQWLNGFLSTLFVQFLQVVAIVVAQMMIGDLVQFLSSSFSAVTAGQAPILDVGTLANIMIIVVLWFIFRIPALLGTAPMRSMVDIGQTMSQTVSTSLGMQLQSAQMSISQYYANQSVGLAGWGLGIGAGTGIAGIAAQSPALIGLLGLA